MKNNILIITGGTGGHVIPASNFYNYVKKHKDNIYLLTDKRGIKFVKNYDQSNIYIIQSSHLSGSIFFKLKGIFKLITGFFHSLIIFIKIRPKIIISFGSYASLTPLICFIFFKFFLKTKLYIHEQNSIMGQTNKLFAYFSEYIFLNFERKYLNIKKNPEKILIVGLPKNEIRIKDYDYENKEKKKINFLVYAGSQGSIDILFIFTAIINALANKNKQNNIKFIVQCTKAKQNQITKLLSKHKYEFQISSFFYDFENILEKSDIALCRSGAGTITDLIDFNIPAILAPLPSSKNNHQFENAKILTDINSAIIVDKDHLDLNQINIFIDKVINDKNFKKSLIDDFKKIRKNEANEIMWKIIKDDTKI